MHSKTARTLMRYKRVARERIVPAVYSPVSGLSVEAWVVGGEPVPLSVALGLSDDGSLVPKYAPFQIGSAWGAPWDTTWFKFSGVAPEGSLANMECLIDLGWIENRDGFQCEGIVFRPDGSIVKGLNPRNRWISLSDLAAPGEPFTFYVEAAANPMVLELVPFNPTPYSDKPSEYVGEIYVLRQAQVARRNVEVADLVQDFEVLTGVAQTLPDDSARKQRILLAVERAMNEFDQSVPVASAEAARQILAPQLSLPANASAHVTWAMGHAHIDSAWLWPVRETQRKVGRTVANVLSLLDKNDDFVFTMSSAIQYKWLEERYPGLFTRLTEYVRQGRIIPVGGMWVEPDGMLPSGESFTRQILMGQKYFMDRFGRRSDVMWMPDSFGYSGALPQIAKLGGMDQFLTQKISWNDTNTFPHHSFWWEGIDGTRILTHFPPSDTYEADVTADELDRAAKAYKEKAISDNSILLFGYGDGGGGPTREMLMRAVRFADLEEAPRVIQRTPTEFFDELRMELAATDDYWTGELYLELHRGTFTTQANAKAANRRSEALIRQAEAAAVKAMLQGQTYPFATLRAAWDKILLGQFHDILPGSSINWVYEDNEQNLADVEKSLNTLEGVGDVRAPSGSSPVGEVMREGADWVLESPSLRAVVSSEGVVTSLLDKASGREVVPPGSALGQMALYKDEPSVWDAWDIDKTAFDTEQIIAGLEDVSSASAGWVAARRKFGRSSAVTTYRLADGGKSLEIQLDVDWHEDEKLLKLLLPFDLQTNTARFETQFGFIERSIHQNTSWDAARFEVPALRWLQVVEGDFGVGVANDSTYGYSIGKTGARGVVVGASVLRSPNFPDQNADRGFHSKKWRIIPTAQTADVIDSAEQLNRVAEDYVGQLVVVDDPSRAVRVSAVKAAEDESGDVIIRLYESLGKRSSATLTLSELFGPFAVSTVDLLEEPLPGDVSVNGSEINVDLGPFQILSLRATRT